AALQVHDLGDGATVGTVDDEIALLEVLEPVRAFLGTWRGEGAGSFPTIEPFRYREEVQFWHVGNPFLGYQQRTRKAASGVPMHSESGFSRATGQATGPSAEAGAVA